jgi:hypothetical protein
MSSTEKKPSARKRTTSSPVRAVAPRRRAATTRSAATTRGAAATSSRPSHEDIARRAYEIFLREGRHGQALEHWLQAERELRRLN